jgi:membrane fusion protein (multidrug efflux system)
MKFWRRQWAVVVVIVVGLMTGCKKPPAPEAEVRVTQVNVVPVVPRKMVDRLMIHATVEPWSTVRLSAEVPGRLVLAAKREGDSVAEGEKLFGIDRATYEARFQEAQARAKYQELYADRSKRLYDKSSISKDEYDKSVADLQAAQAALASAKVELDRTDVLSPLTGVYDVESAKVGEYLSGGAPLGTLVDVSRVKVIAAVPEKDISFVKVGDEMNITFDSIDKPGDPPRKGKVIFIKEVGDADTLTFPVHLEVDNADRRIRPPMIAKVELIRRTVSDAIAVPLFAVIPDVVGWHVFVEKDGKALLRKVQLSFAEGGLWHVTGELQAGDRLIVNGQRNLADGDRVDVQPMPEGLRPMLKTMNVAPSVIEATTTPGGSTAAGTKAEAGGRP